MEKTTQVEQQQQREWPFGVEGLNKLADMASKTYNGPSEVCNFTTKSQSGARRMMSSAGQADLTVDALDGEVFRLRHWLATQATYRNEKTGELTDGVRITFWDDSERSLTFSSWTVTHWLDLLVKSFGMGPYDPPVGVIVKHKIERDGKRTFSLDLVEIGS